MRSGRQIERNPADRLSLGAILRTFAGHMSPVSCVLAFSGAAASSPQVAALEEAWLSAHSPFLELQED